MEDRVKPLNTFLDSRIISVPVTSVYEETFRKSPPPPDFTKFPKKWCLKETVLPYTGTQDFLLLATDWRGNYTYNENNKPFFVKTALRYDEANYINIHSGAANSAPDYWLNRVMHPFAYEPPVNYELVFVRDLPEEFNLFKQFWSTYQVCWLTKG